MTYVKFNKNDPLNGILSNFYKMSPDFISFNSTLGGYSSNQSIVVERNQSECLFWHGRQSDGNFTIILKQKLLLTDYVLENAGCSSSTRSHPEEFNLYGSNDNKKWTLIDKRTDQKFCGKPGCDTGVIQNYTIKTPKPFTHFKFESSRNSEDQNRDYFIMRQIEFFGVINPPQHKTQCIKTYSRSFTYYIIYIVYST